MEDSKELKELKSTLRSLVVSSPTQMDLRALLRDYRNMMGQTLPISKFGYRDPLQFLKDHCADCFLVLQKSLNIIGTPDPNSFWLLFFILFFLFATL